MGYPTFRPVTKPSHKQQKSHRINFAEHKKQIKQILKTRSFHKVKIYDKRLQIQ